LLIKIKTPILGCKTNKSNTPINETYICNKHITVIILIQRGEEDDAPARRTTPKATSNRETQIQNT